MRKRCWVRFRVLKSSESEIKWNQKLVSDIKNYLPKRKCMVNFYLWLQCVTWNMLIKGCMHESWHQYPVKWTLGTPSIFLTFIHNLYVIHSLSSFSDHAHSAFGWVYHLINTKPRLVFFETGFCHFIHGILAGDCMKISICHFWENIEK